MDCIHVKAKIDFRQLRVEVSRVNLQFWACNFNIDACLVYLSTAKHCSSSFCNKLAAVVIFRTKSEVLWPKP